MKTIVATPSTTIRTVERGDREVFAAVRDLLAQLYPDLSPLERDRFERVVAGDVVTLFVAEVDGAVVGCASLVRYEKLGGIVHLIEDVVVDQDHRGQGIGSRMTEVMVEYARKQGADLVDVGTRRPRARDFYRESGFHDKDGERDYFALRKYLD